MTRTTLSVAISAPTFGVPNQITLASVTGLLVGNLILIDTEFMLTKAINTTSLIVDVIRGQNGSTAKSHGAGSAAVFGTPDEFVAGVLNGLKLTRVDPTAQLTTAGALTYTAGQLIGGRINRDPNGAARTDTLPTAVLLVAAIPGVQINDTFTFEVVNQADAAETITIAIGTNGTIGTNTPAAADGVTVTQNNKKRFRIRFTGVLPGAEAYTLTNESGLIAY